MKVIDNRIHSEVALMDLSAKDVFVTVNGRVGMVVELPNPEIICVRVVWLDNGRVDALTGHTKVTPVVATLTLY